MSSRPGRRFWRCSRSSAVEGARVGRVVHLRPSRRRRHLGRAGGRRDHRRQPARRDAVRGARLRLRALSRLSRLSRGDDAQGRAAAHDRRAPPAARPASPSASPIPKAYPVALAMFSAIVAPYVDRLSMADAPQLLAAAFVGFLAADATLIFAAGLPAGAPLLPHARRDRDARRRRDVHRLRREIDLRCGERGDATGVTRDA